MKTGERKNYEKERKKPSWKLNRKKEKKTGKQREKSNGTET